MAQAAGFQVTWNKLRSTKLHHKMHSWCHLLSIRRAAISSPIWSNDKVFKDIAALLHLGERRLHHVLIVL